MERVLGPWPARLTGRLDSRDFYALPTFNYNDFVLPDLYSVAGINCWLEASDLCVFFLPHSADPGFQILAKISVCSEIPAQQMGWNLKLASPDNNFRQSPESANSQNVGAIFDSPVPGYTIVTSIAASSWSASANSTCPTPANPGSQQVLVRTFSRHHVFQLKIVFLPENSSSQPGYS